MGEKIALVTGGTSGIGKKLVDNLTMDGYFVYVLSRSKSKGELLDIFPDNYNSIKHIAVNFGEISEIKKVIEYISTINKIDVFILNHGVSKDTNEKNENGKYNKLFLVNTISTILFTNGMIKVFPNSRYIFISSISSSIYPYCLIKIDFNKYFKNKNSDLIEYGLSKYCLNLFSMYLYEYYEIRKNESSSIRRR